MINDTSVPTGQYAFMAKVNIADRERQRKAKKRKEKKRMVLFQPSPWHEGGISI
jgi:hypothetical protein